MPKGKPWTIEEEKRLRKLRIEMQQQKKNGMKRWKKNRETCLLMLYHVF